MFYLKSVCLSVINFTWRLPIGSARKFYQRCICGQGRNEYILEVIWRSSVSVSGSRNFVKDLEYCEVRHFSIPWLISTPCSEKVIYLFFHIFLAVFWQIL